MCGNRKNILQQRTLSPELLLSAVFTDRIAFLAPQFNFTIADFQGEIFLRPFFCNESYDAYIINSSSDI